MINRNVSHNNHIFEYECMKTEYPVDLVDPVILSKIYHFTHTIRYRALIILSFKKCLYL